MREAALFCSFRTLLLPPGAGVRLLVILRPVVPTDDTSDSAAGVETILFSSSTSWLVLLLQCST